MRNQKKNIIFAAGLVLFMLLLWLPKTPFIQENTTKNELKIEIATALADLEKAPMQGIQKLIQLTEKYPNAWEPYFELGWASVKTAQYEKAIGRFTKALTLIDKEPYSKEKENIYIGLSIVYEEELKNLDSEEKIDEKNSKKIAFKDLLIQWSKESDDPILKKEIEKKIIKLNLK